MAPEPEISRDGDQPFADRLRAALQHTAARRGGLGDPCQYVPVTGSTMDVAATAALEGAPEGWLVVAGTQTAGRGRRGHTWASPEGAGLYASLILRPRTTRHVGETAAPASLLTLAAGVAVADGIETATGLSPTLKWPNDVFCGRKVAGVLAEAHGIGAGTQAVVLGLGINIRDGALPPGLRDIATSLEAAAGRTIDPGQILSEVLSALAEQYAAISDGRAAGMLAAWRRRAAPCFGRAVEWDEAGERRHGEASDVSEDGALLVRTSSGTARVVAGEVRWR